MTDHTAPRAITFAGEVDDEDKYYKTSYIDRYGSWNDVIMIEFIKVTFQNYSVIVRINAFTI